MNIPKFIDLGEFEKLEERRKTNTIDEFKAEHQAKKIDQITSFEQTKFNKSLFI